MELPPRRTLATETRQIDGFIECLSCELQELFRARRIPAAVAGVGAELALDLKFRARRIPAAVAGVGAELALDLFARERLVYAAADVRLALFEHAAVREGHLDMSGVSLRIRIVRIDDVAHFGSERENARVAHRLVGKGLEPGAAGDERDGDIEGRTEFGGVVVRRPVFGCERLPQSVHVAFRRFA